MIIAIAGLAVYANSLTGPLIFDDWGAIEDNETIRDLWNWRSLVSPPVEQPTAGRPLVNLSFAINYAAGGLDVRGYHAANIAFHLSCALLIFGIVRRTLDSHRLRHLFGAQSAVLAFVVALLWTLHPLNTEVVDYLSQRTESMMALFYLLTMYACIREIEPHGKKWRGIAVLACAAGMASKESMATAPVAIVLYDISFRFGSIAEAWKSRRRLYLMLASTWAVLIALMWSGPRVLTAGFSTSVTLWTYLLNQAGLLVRYLHLAVWPRDLVLNYGRPVSLTLRDVAPEALLIAALVALTIYLWARKRPLGFLAVWFFMTIAPTTLVPIATEVGAERRMYLPLIALIVLVVGGLFHAYRRLRAATDHADVDRFDRILGAVAVLVVSIALGAAAIARNREYRLALTMAQTVLERWPTGVAHAMVGVASGEAGLHDAAIAHFRDAIAQGHVLGRYPLAVELFEAGQVGDAIDQLRLLLGQPNDVDGGTALAARMMLAQAFLRQEQWAEAIAECQAILAESPSNPIARRALADAWFGQRDFERAATEYAAYLASRPRDLDALENLGLALAKRGKLREAADAFGRIVRLAPTDRGARVNFVLALLQSGDLPAAEREARAALLIHPDDPELQHLLGRATGR